MSSIARELNALDTIIAGAVQIASEALDRKADIKQGRIAIDAYGRANTALQTSLNYRLARLRLQDIETRVVDGEATEQPAAISGAA